MLKKIGIGVLAVIILLIIISYLLPQKVVVERSIEINAPIEVVYDQVNDFHNWTKWSPWSEKDPNMKIEYFGSAKGVGSKYCWDGDPETVGKGCLSIVKNEENASINTLLEFEGMSPGNGSWTFEEISDGVKVTWGMESSMEDMPIVGGYFGLMMDGFIGPDFEKGLNKMKKVAESMPSYSLEIKEDNMPAMNYIYVRSTAPESEIGAKMGEMSAKMEEYMKKNKLQMAGMPFAIWHSVDDIYDFSFALPVSGELGEGTDEVMISAMDQFKCIKGDYYGDYSKMENAHMDMNTYIKTNGLEQMGEPIEFYATDPMNEPDTAKWLTYIVYPIS